MAARRGNPVKWLFPQNYLTLYFGKFSLGDLFDSNEYSNSPRTQFMNWALMNNGAWDYAANVRGYTYENFKLISSIIFVIAFINGQFFWASSLLTTDRIILLFLLLKDPDLPFYPLFGVGFPLAGIAKG